MGQKHTCPDAMSVTDQRIHNVIFSIPRTASNLMVRILNLEHQSSILRHPRDGYLFLPTMRFKSENDMHSRFHSDWTPSERSGMNDVLRSCVAEWMQHAEAAEKEGKGTCIKEHVNWMIKPDIEETFGAGTVEDVDEKYKGNPTCIPQYFWRRKLRATVLIRHPALVVPSLLRTALDNEGREAMMEEVAEERLRREVSYRWLVEVYKMFEHITWPERWVSVKHPIVLDAADLGNKTLMEKYAREIGLDAEKLLFVWDVQSAEGMGSVEARMRDTLMKSQGVVAEKLAGAEDFDISALEGKWHDEFGDKLGHIVTRLVRGAMVEYNWLREKRLTIEEKETK